MNEKNENFPNGLEAVFLFIALLMAEYVAGAALYDMHGTLALQRGDYAGLIALIGNGIVFTAVMQRKSLSYRELFHSSSSSMGATIIMLVPALTLTVPLLLLASLTLSAMMVTVFPLSGWEERMFAEMSEETVGAVVAACILAPVLEEMLFRGIILRSFLRQYAKWPAIFGSAALFGFAHMNLYQYVIAVGIGVYLGWLYERTRSLLPCIALHAVYNIGCTVLGSGRPDDELASFSIFSANSWAGALILAMAGVYLLRILLGYTSTPPR